MRIAWRALECQVVMNGSERLVILGNFIANVGRGEGRSGVTGKCGVGRVNEAGRDLLDRCEENRLTYVNINMRHARSVTCFNLRFLRWYELDGFVVNWCEKNKSMSMVNTRWLFDHHSMVLKLRCSKRRWMTTRPNVTNSMRVNCKRLEYEEKKGEFVMKTAEKMKQIGDPAEGDVWKKLTGAMTWVGNGGTSGEKPLDDWSRGRA